MLAHSLCMNRRAQRGQAALSVDDVWTLKRACRWKAKEEFSCFPVLLYLVASSNNPVLEHIRCIVNSRNHHSLYVVSTENVQASNSDRWVGDNTYNDA